MGLAHVDKNQPVEEKVTVDGKLNVGRRGLLPIFFSARRSRLVPSPPSIRAEHSTPSSLERSSAQRNGGGDGAAEAQERGAPDRRRH